MAINLHAIVRAPITALHPDELVALYKSTGQANVLGRIKPTYAPGVLVWAQIQMLSADELQQREDTSKTGLDAKMYLNATEKNPPSGIIRHMARNGDFIRRADGTWWLVVSVLEEFTKSGWECLGIACQTQPPDIDDKVFGFIEDVDETGTFNVAPFMASNSVLGSVLYQKESANG